MQKEKVSTAGIFSAVSFSLVATIGQSLTSARCCDRYDWIWIGIFALSLLTLSGAVVNFDPKRWLR